MTCSHVYAKTVMNDLYIRGDFGVLNNNDLKLYEAYQNGSNYLSLKSPVSLSNNLTFQLPSEDGTAGQVLSTDGNGALSFITITGASTPSGVITAYVGVTPPLGWLNCDGSAVSRTTYADLYAVIGDKFGNGDGVTTFNLPDFRGRFLRGWDNSAGNDPVANSRTAINGNSGASTGDNIGSFQSDAYQGHHHTVVGSNVEGWGGTHYYPAFTSSFNGFGGKANMATTNQSDGVNGAPRISSETRPVNVSVNYIIKI